MKPYFEYAFEKLLKIKETTKRDKIIDHDFQHLLFHILLLFTHTVTKYSEQYKVNLRDQVRKKESKEDKAGVYDIHEQEIKTFGFVCDERNTRAILRRSFQHSTLCNT